MLRVREMLGMLHWVLLAHLGGWLIPGALPVAPR